MTQSTSHRRHSSSIAAVIAGIVALVGTLLTTAVNSRAQENALRVCADPNYLPFSNRAGTGFENQIATYVAHSLGMPLTYVFASSRGPGGFDQFVHDTLDAHKCDLVMDVPYASDNVSATKPYYISSYVFVYPKKKHYDISSMDSPALAKLKIGFESDTPAENGLKLRALILHAVPFDTAEPSASPTEILDAVRGGKVAVGITWEPAIGYFLQRDPSLEVVAVPNSRSMGSPEQYSFPMSMATRSDSATLRDRISRLIDAHKSELQAILARNGVRLYKPGSDVAAR